MTETCPLKKLSLFINEQLLYKAQHNIQVLCDTYKLFLSTKIAEVIDDRPEEVKQMEVFRTGNRWKVIGGNCFICFCF